MIKEAVGYTTVCASNAEELSHKVKRYLDPLSGWEPTGGVTTLCDAEGGSWLMQALTRYNYNTYNNSGQ